MPLIIPESRVVEIWQGGLAGLTGLATEDGEAVKIVYPGRINHDRGADFLDAVIATNCGLIKGDVEIHVMSSGWRAHSHHRDPAYNRVMLHVVFWHDTETPVTLQNGQRVPTLALCKFLEQTDRYAPASYPPANMPVPCRSRSGIRDKSVTAGILDKAGEERFTARVAEFETSMTGMGADQMLYRGIMEALGYSKNKRPMAELARRVPLHRLESAASAATSDDGFLAWQQALLMGTAGLLPHQLSSRSCWEGADERCVEMLEAMWESSGGAVAMSEGDWHFSKVRPVNYPTRRIAAVSYLLRRYREAGLFNGLVDCLNGIPEDAGCNVLEQLLLVAADAH